MTDPETETTAGGLAGKLAGKVKEAAGELLGDDHLAREGRLQESAADADIRARREEAEARTRAEEARIAEDAAATDEERRRLKAEIAAENAEQRIEHERFTKEAEGVDPKEDPR